MLGALEVHNAAAGPAGTLRVLRRARERERDSKRKTGEKSHRSSGLGWGGKGRRGVDLGWIDGWITLWSSLAYGWHSVGQLRVPVWADEGGNAPAEERQ